MFVAEIVVHSPRKRFFRLGSESLKPFVDLHLVRAIDQSVVDCEAIVDRKTGTEIGLHYLHSWWAGNSFWPVDFDS
jgi:hypothetical protein